ncbi:Methicillin resistance mecR1 protein [Symmachiella dynata]|uniref:M56 family metallopeptidase n=1 Tax=Symmachiella dynata TaxID=2527995 RepID=UPI001187D739|nr:M56 family metallopeptidase [Symmachiella dynata]QDT50515.1 Methicillin resistance mecR1 protein [Symmachiella dynata]
MTFSGQEIAALLVAHTWQVTLLIAVVLVVIRYYARNRPHLAHVLWVVVLLKCITPPLWSSPGGIFCWLQPAAVTRTAEKNPGPVPAGGMKSVSAAAIRNAWGNRPAPQRVPMQDTKIEATAEFAEVIVESERRQGFEGSFISETLITIWLIGSISALAIAGIRWAWCWSKIQRMGTYRVESLESVVSALSKRLKLKRRVRLVVTRSPIGPAVIAWFRPVILLPEILVHAKTSQELEPVLAHELVHIRRGDLRISLLQLLASALWWFHPLVHWAGRLAVRESEHCCDEEVIAELNFTPEDYARSLIDVLELKQKLKPVPVFPGVRPLEITSKRLERIMNQGRFHKRTPWYCWLVMAAVAATVLPGAAMIVTADDNQDSRPGTNAVVQQARSNMPEKNQNKPAIIPAPEPLIVVNYNVGDLIDLIRRQSRQAAERNEDKRDAEKQSVSVGTALELLKQLIKISVEPQSWRAPSGADPALVGCSISEFETTKSLVVRQTAQGHKRLIEFLNQLRVLLQLKHASKLGEIRMPQAPEAESEITTVNYAVADLVVPVPARLNLDPQGTHRQTTNDNAGKPDFAALIDLIKTTVRPDSWQEVGGAGTIQTFENTLSLVIRQSAEIHQGIAELLTQLRRLRDLQVTLEVHSLYVTDEQYEQELGFLPSKFDAGNTMTLTSAQAASFRKLALKSNSQKPLSEPAIKTTGEFDTHGPVLGKNIPTNLPANPLQRSVKITLFNGQICTFPIAYPTVGHDTQNALGEIQSLVSADRKYVRLTFKVDTTTSLEPLQGAVKETLEDGQPFLIDVSDQLRFVNRGDSAASEKTSEKLSKKRAKRTMHGRLLFSIYPRIIIKEEEAVIVPH